jgi:hypothetical protein
VTPYSKQLQRTVTRRRAAAELRRYAVTCSSSLVRLVLVCIAFAPQLSRAQSCEWDRFAEPPADADVIEVSRRGGYGPAPFSGRTLVSVEASGRIALLAVGQCPDRTLVGRVERAVFEALVDELGQALTSVRSQPPRPMVSADHPFEEIIREGRVEPLCQSPVDGVDVDVTLYRAGSKEHHECVTGALLRFGENVLRLVSDSICANRTTSVCIKRMVGQP